MSSYSSPLMKLIVCIINARDKNKLGDVLIEQNFNYTIIGSTGGFLKQGNATFLIGLEEGRLSFLYELIEQNCQGREETINPVPFEGNLTGIFMQPSMKVNVGGATLFVLDVEQFRRF